MATNPPEDDKGNPSENDKRREALTLDRETFAKISEVEGVRLGEDMKAAFAQFDQQGLPHEKRRRAIIDRFRRAAK